MKNGIFIAIILLMGFQAEAQMKIGHINSQELLDTLQSRKDAMAKLKEFESEGVRELQEMNKAFESSYLRYQQNEKDWSPVIQKMEQEMKYHRVNEKNFKIGTSMRKYRNHQQPTSKYINAYKTK